MDAYLTRAYEPGFPAEWEGLDHASAQASTPKLYGVSFGNGNNGISHMYPDYYCRTSDPYTLASAALIGQFKAEYMAQAADEMDTGGEAEYTIYATLYEPLDRDEPEEDSEDDYGSYSDANGAYMICEVFQVDVSDLPDQSDPWAKRPYASLEDCFGAEAPELKLARES